MKILLLDIETAPMLGYSWDIYKEQNSMEFIIKDWYMLCWCAKWLDNKEIIWSALPEFASAYQNNPQNDYHIIKKLWDVMNEADVIVTQNGIRFDLPKINAKLIEYHLPPVKPYKKVDTCLTARKMFGFSSNKLNDLAKVLKIGSKKETGGFKLWYGCMHGDHKCWEKMVKYCKNDVVLLEKVYKRMLPFMSGHPNRNLYSAETELCPKCGSNKIQNRGYRITVRGKVPRYQCQKCGGWCQGKTFIKNDI